MSFYERYVLSKIIDRGMRDKRFARLRKDLLPRAEGVVLDVGMGSGANLPFYDSARVELVYGLEPSPSMRDLSRKAIDVAPFEVKLLEAGAESIPLENDTVDTAVLTFVLCTIPNPAAALAEIQRVLKPNGLLLYCEHGAAGPGATLKIQRALTPVWKRLAGGCHLARPIPELISDGDFNLSIEQSGYVRGIPRIGGFVYRGEARAATD